MRELAALLTRGDESVALDLAALQIAAIEHPDLTPEPWIHLLDSHARELEERLPAGAGGESFVAAMNEYLFEELRFEGNHEDYYDPLNSCLNDVLTRRRGIPITLSLVCLEIARRLDRPLAGIGLPGHFLLRYDDGEFAAYIDPFNRGQLLFHRECFDLARRVTGLPLADDPALLAPVSKRQLVLRMLNNLRAAYLLHQEPHKALAVLDLLIEANPHSPEEIRERGVLRMRLNLFRSACADFESYLQLVPGSVDRAEVERHLATLRGWMKRLH